MALADTDVRAPTAVAELTPVLSRLIPSHPARSIDFGIVLTPGLFTDSDTEVRALTDSDAHVSVDAVGIEETCRNAVNSLRARRRHVQIVFTTDEEQGDISIPTTGIVTDKLEFLGLIGLQPATHDNIVRILGHDRLNSGAVVTGEIRRDDVSDECGTMTESERNESAWSLASHSLITNQ